MNTSQLISNTTIPNHNLFHTLRNPKPRMPRTALVIWDIGVFTLYLSHHDGKGMVNFDLAQTAGMAQTRGD